MAIICDANKLPEEIKSKAHEYIKKHSPRFKTFGVTRDDVECAWLNGFAFCLEGIVEVKVKQCATCVYVDSTCTSSDCAKGNKGQCANYKSVFVENAELKQKLNILEDRTPWKDIKDKSELIGKLTKAKEIIKTLLLIADNKVSQMEFQLCVADAKQFLKESKEDESQ